MEPRDTMENLSEMALRVLAVLEEPQKENVFPMLNTIIDSNGAEEEVILLQGALKELTENDLVLMGMEAFYPRNPEKLDKAKSLSLIANLPEWFRFETDGSYWTLANGDIRKERTPEIYATASGLEVGDRIMQTRDHQWWRRKS